MYSYKKRIVIIGSCFNDVEIPESIETYLGRFGEPEEILLIEDYASLISEIMKNGSDTEYYFFPTAIPGQIRRSINGNRKMFLRLLKQMNASLGYLQIETVLQKRKVKQGKKKIVLT